VRGDGCITKRKDGRWQAALVVNCKRRIVYGRTKAEARKKLAELRQQVARTGTLPEPGRRTVADLLEAWLEVAAQSLKPATLESYRDVARLHIIPAIGGVKLSKLEPLHLQKLYTHLERHGKRRTGQKCHALLHRAFRIATLWGWLAENPAARVLRPRYTPQRRELWTAEELAAFLAGTREHWLHPLWTLAIATGARLGELLALGWDDVDLQAQTARICKTLHRIGHEWVFTEPKTRSAVRVITLPPEAISALRKQKAQQSAWRLRAGPEWQDHGLVFSGLHGQPLCQSTVNHALRRECLRLGIHVLSAHSLRHLHASLLLAEGLPLPEVSRRLGHANPNITATIYAHAISTEDMAAQAIGRVLSRVGR
jgi:integrase